MSDIVQKIPDISFLQISITDIQTMVLIKDGNSEHVVNETQVVSVKKNLIATALDLRKCLKQIN